MLLVTKSGRFCILRVKKKKKTYFRSRRPCPARCGLTLPRFRPLRRRSTFRPFRTTHRIVSHSHRQVLRWLWATASRSRAIRSCSHPRRTSACQAQSPSFLQLSCHSRFFKLMMTFQATRGCRIPTMHEVTEMCMHLFQSARFFLQRFWNYSDCRA